jgi:hypothetical protein
MKTLILYILSQISPTLVPIDAVERYTQISSHPLHKTNKPGILSMDIHPTKVSLLLYIDLNIRYFSSLVCQIAKVAMGWKTNSSAI